jgi:hypothetical protein
MAAAKTAKTNKAAQAHGHKPGTVDRAKQTLNITATKVGFEGGWGNVFVRPSKEIITPEPPNRAIESDFDSGGALRSSMPD